MMHETSESYQRIEELDEFHYPEAKQIIDTAIRNLSDAYQKIGNLSNKRFNNE